MSHFPITDRLREMATRHADQPAIATDREQLTFSELALAVSRAGAWLSDLKQGLGRRVMLVENREIDDVVLLLAALATPDTFTVVPVDVARTGAIDLPEHDVALDAPCDTRSDSRTISKLGWRSHSGPKGHVEYGADPPTLLVPTSGSTGPPQWVIHDQESVFRSIRALEDAPASSAERARWLSIFPLGTIGGLVIVLRYIAGGSCVVLPPRTRIRVLARMCSQFDVTGLALFPEAVSALSRHLQHHPGDFKSVKVVGSGGSPLDRTLAADLEANLGAVVVDSYGATELGGPVLISIGAVSDFAVMPTVAIRLGDPCSFERAAELRVRIDVRPRGYWVGEHEDPVPYVDAEGWYSTGDVFVLRQGAGLVYSHRLDEGPIVMAGATELADAVAGIHAALDQGHCAVLYGDIEPSISGVWLFVERGTHSWADAKRVANQILSALVSIPYRLIIVDRIPRTAIGKVRISELRNRCGTEGGSRR